MSDHRGLPGDMGKAERLESILRVDQAGEFGATRIYAGQLAVLGRSPAGKTIRHMAAQEDQHLVTFDRDFRRLLSRSQYTLLVV